MDKCSCLWVSGDVDANGRMNVLVVLKHVSVGI